VTTPTASIRCPYCMEQNVEPRGDMWFCRDCEKPFEEAAAQISAPPAKKRKPQ